MVPDYYAMLGIDQDAGPDEIEAALARCRPKWSAGSRNPKHRHTYQSYLDQIPEIRRRLLGDPAERAAYDAELDADRQARLDQALEALRKLIRLRASKGGLTVSDRDRLRERADALHVSQELLDQMLEPISPLPEAPAEADDEPEPEGDRLDAATWGQIRRSLEHLGKRDLYDALGLERDAPQDELLRAAAETRERWRLKTKVSAEMTTWLEVASYAQTHLGSPENRARYDRTLDQETERLFLEHVEFAVEGEPALAPGTLDALKQEAQALGIEPARAERLIRRRCRKLAVALEGSPRAANVDPPPRLLRCRSCSGLTEYPHAERNGRACRHCGESLRWECPICKKTHWVDEPRCACGFRLIHRRPMLEHFEAARQAHRAKDYARAQEHLERVQEIAPRHAGTKKALDEVRNQIAEIDQARARFEQEAAARRWVAAEAALRDWAQRVVPSDPNYRNAYDQTIAALKAARSAAGRAAARLERDPAEARRLYQEALDRAADLPEAQEGLRRCPPDPPTHLKANVEGDRVRLRWSPPPPDGLGSVSYLVVRKLGGVPSHPQDGAVLAETRSAEQIDTDPEPGETIGYAVFSRRNGLESSRAATFGPALILADVGDPRAEPSDRLVELSWRLPRRASGAQVRRSTEKPPERPDEGDAVPALRDGAVDRNLQNDRIYHYTIFAEYRTADGRRRFSKGVPLEAMPHPALTEVAHLRVEPSDQGVQIRWRVPERGQVRILRTEGPPGVPGGRRLTVAELDALEGDWLPVAAPGLALDASPPRAGFCHYTPFTCWAGSALAGPATLFSRLPDPTDVRAVRIGVGRRVHLRWRWPPQAQRSIVALKAGAPADGPFDPQAQHWTVLESDYARRKFFPIDVPESSGAPFHITVYSETRLEGKRLVSPGLEPSARTVVPGPLPEVRLSYVLKPPRFTSRQGTLKLKTDPPGAEVPPTVLVGHPRTVPLSPDDGEILARFPAGRDGSSFRVPHKARQLRARLFLDPTTPPDAIAPIRIRHPDAERTRI